MGRIDVPTTDETMNELGLYFQKIYSNDFKVDKRSQWYMFMFPLVHLFTIKMQGIQASLDQGNIWKAEGTNLDDLLSGNSNFRRNQASYSKVDIKLKGVQGTVLNVGDITIQTTNNITFILNENGTMPANGELILEFIADIPGIVGNKTQTEFIKFLSVVNGIYAFQTFENSSGGSDTETDTEYRIRWFLSNKEAEWNINGIISEVLKVDGVSDVYADQNKQNQMIDGLPPKSVVVVVNGGRNEDIAKAIFKKVDHSIETIGNVVVNVPDIQGIDREIKFYRPTQTEIEYKINVAPALGVVVNIDDLKILVENYLSNIKLGKYITSDECNKSYIRPTFDTTKLLNVDIQFRRQGDINFSNFIKLNFNEVAYGKYTI